MELIREREYDDITIQDIVDRANIGRTTFYLHYNNKDELFMSCHEAILRDFHIGVLHPLSREELFSPEIPPQVSFAYGHLDEGRRLLYPIFHGKDSPLILRQIRERSAQEIEANLRAIFDETECAIPLDLFATYLAGAQISLMQWWLEKRRAHTADELTRTLYHMQRAAIRDAFGLQG
jgi:AcrR family transcriptional regulator